MEILLEFFLTIALVGQQVAVDVVNHVGCTVEFQYVVTAHLKGLLHHVVQVGRTRYSVSYTGPDKSAKQEYNDDGDNCSCQNDDGDGRRVVMDALGMEPFVVYLLHFSALLHACKLIVDGIYKLFVVSHDTDITIGDVDGAGVQSVEGKFLFLPHQGTLSPDEIVIAAVVDSCKGIFRGSVFDRDSNLLLVENLVGRIVVALEDKRVGFRQLVELGNWACALT